MQDKFGDAALTWSSLADYAACVHGLLDAQAEIHNKSDTQENVAKILNFMAATESIEAEAEPKKDGGANISLFKQLANAKNQADAIHSKREPILAKIEDVSALEKLVAQ